MLHFLLNVVRALGLRTALSLKWQEEHLLIVDSCNVEVKRTGGRNEQNAKTAPVNDALTKMIGDNLAMIIDGQEKNTNFDLSTRNMRRVLYHPQLVSAREHCEM